MTDVQLVVLYSHCAGQNVRVQTLPQKGQTLSAASWLCDRDGAKGTNVAVSAARLGTKTALVSRTGDDFWAVMADSLLRGTDVDTAFLVRDPNDETPTGVVFVDDAGDNAIVLSPAKQTIPREQIDRALEAYAGAAYAASGYELDAACADYALQAAQSWGMKTALNPSPIPTKRPDLSFVTLLFVNEHEAAGLLALAGEACPADMGDAARALRRLYGCPQIVITLGGNGYTGLDGEEAFCGAGLCVKAVDTSGAGDGFMGATLSRLCRGETLAQACAFANRYASYAVQASGTVPGYLTLEEMQQRQKNQSDGVL